MVSEARQVLMLFYYLLSNYHPRQFHSQGPRGIDGFSRKGSIGERGDIGFPGKDGKSQVFCFSVFFKYIKVFHMS